MISPLPSPPTDNIHKFLAVSGGLTFIALAVLATADVRHVRSHIVAADSAIAVLEVDIQQASQDTALGRNRIWELRRKVALLSATKRRITDLNRTATQDVRLLTIGGIIAGIWWLLGMWSWMRSQRMLDELLRLQVEEARVKLSAAKSGDSD